MTPLETVQAFIRAVEAHDVDAAIALTAPSISYENVPIAPIVGHDGLRATLESFLGPAAEVDWQIGRELAVGSVVVNERLDRFRIGDGWLELPVAGFFEVDDEGKISLWRDYFDLQTYMTRFAELTGG